MIRKLFHKEARPWFIEDDVTGTKRFRFHPTLPHFNHQAIIFNFPERFPIQLANISRVASDNLFYVLGASTRNNRSRKIAQFIINFDFSCFPFLWLNIQMTPEHLNVLSLCHPICWTSGEKFSRTFVPSRVRSRLKLAHYGVIKFREFNFGGVWFGFWNAWKVFLVT